MGMRNNLTIGVVKLQIWTFFLWLLQAQLSVATAILAADNLWACLWLARIWCFCVVGWLVTLAAVPGKATPYAHTGSGDPMPASQELFFISQSSWVSCSRREDGLSCWHGVKPPLTHSWVSQSFETAHLPLMNGSTHNLKTPNALWTFVDVVMSSISILGQPGQPECNCPDSSFKAVSLCWPRRVRHGRWITAMNNSQPVLSH